MKTLLPPEYVQQRDDDARTGSMDDGAPRASITEGNYDWRGPFIGSYSIARGGAVYDVNDFFSRPRTMCGILVRSPPEAAVNVAALVTLIVYFGADFAIDPLITFLKAVHHVFHAGLHALPEWSTATGAPQVVYRKPRVVCGIVMGLTRYAVILTYAYRVHPAWLLAFGAFFGAATALRTLGEIIKTLLAMLLLAHRMAAEPELRARACLLGLAFVCQTIGSGGFYLTCLLRGRVYKLWRRTSDRKLLAWHLISDVGNALFMLSAQVLTTAGLADAPVAAVTRSVGRLR